MPVVKTVKPQLLLDIASIVSVHQDVNVCVTASGELILVTGHGSGDLSVLRWRNSRSIDLVLLPEPMGEGRTIVQPLYPNGWVAIRPRLDARGSSNAMVYSADGAPLRSFLADDGIAHVQTDKKNGIWVGYFDVGVFSGGDLAKHGLVRFNVDGHPDIYYSEIASLANAPHIHDCYALNVSSDGTAWLFYYSNFPLVKLVDGRIERIWQKVDVPSGTAIAIGDRGALFAGRVQMNLCLYQFDFASGRVTMLTPAIDGVEEPHAVQPIAGRGNRIYLRHGSKVLYLKQK